MRHHARIVLLGALLTAAADCAPAQTQRPHRTGFWAEISGGPGHARVACSGCVELATAPGWSSLMRVGGLLSDKVMLGIETFGFADQAFTFVPVDLSGVASTGGLSVVAVWFPGASGFFVKGGIGMVAASLAAPTTDTQSDTTEAVGVGMTFGLGYDFVISRRFAVTANVGSSIAAVGDLILPGRRVDDVIATMYHATIGLTVR